MGCTIGAHSSEELFAKYEETVPLRLVLIKHLSEIARFAPNMGVHASAEVIDPLLTNFI